MPEVGHGHWCPPRGPRPPVVCVCGWTWHMLSMACHAGSCTVSADMGSRFNLMVRVAIITTVCLEGTARRAWALVSLPAPPLSPGSFSISNYWGAGLGVLTPEAVRRLSRRPRLAVPRSQHHSGTGVSDGSDSASIPVHLHRASEGLSPCLLGEGPGLASEGHSPGATSDRSFLPDGVARSVSSDSTCARVRVCVCVQAYTCVRVCVGMPQFQEWLFLQ